MQTRTRSRTRWWLPAALVTAAVITLAGCGSDTTTGDTDTGTVDTTAAPDSVTWTNYRGVKVPVSSTGGPSTNGKVPGGYAHSPQGAVLAAMQGQTRLALAPDDEWPTVASTVLAFGPGRDAYAIARSMTSITDAADPAQTAQYAGFRVDDYSDDHAAVSLVTRMPGGRLAASPTTLTWKGNDWRITLPDPAANPVGDDGTAATDPTALDSLDSYTPLSAQEA
ncbi:hypothetical protein ACFTWF_35090 [Rhodococcus sp. NPDC056960]|uniref:hypothetical protein n=1 Tax=Rhodococcus sp. NPDC056960 TaxID=3345982 RepID=UPI0036386DCC